MNPIEQNLHLANGITVHPDPSGFGHFLQFNAEKPAARHVFPVGELTGITRFTALHRYEPFWMKAMAGTRGGEIPVETQFFLSETESGDCLLLVPLISEPFRAALQGTGENGLELVAETGDPALVGTEVIGLYIASGPNPYDLIAEAAPCVMAAMQTGRLRYKKPLPEFIDQFGWCTWDAFYQDVTGPKVREGLESFRAGGVEPKLLILDDGWQSIKEFPTGEKRLTSFDANEKFPGDLRPVVTIAKQEFGIETFLVWHAFHGYWGGVDAESLPGYGVISLAREYSPTINDYAPSLLDWFGKAVGVVSPEHIYRFYQDYHRQLRLQGVDGVKVDNQAALEGAARGLGGRVGLMRRYREALEGSVHTHFGGNLINCMSCTNEMLYGALNSNLTRTSTDFWPKRPESHGDHLYVNAQVSLWFGEFIHPDWDMFQSGHPMGAYHAVGRAVSGSPVYVSDKPGEQDFDLLRKLVLPDGSVLRCEEPGRPTRDCLFHDPTKEPILLKIFNHNAMGGVLGVFNGRYGGEGTPSEPITGVVRPSDVEGIEGKRFAVFAHHRNELRVLSFEETWEISLPELTAELFTIAAIEEGILAPIGLADKFNSGGALRGGEFILPDLYELIAQGGSNLLFWCETPPVAVAVNDEFVSFLYDDATNRLEIAMEETGEFFVRLNWKEEA